MSQTNRMIRVSSNFIDDSCVVLSLTGTEKLSAPFQFDLVFSSHSVDLGSKDVIGQKLGITLNEPRSGKTTFRHGRVNGLALLDVDENGVRHYQISVVPGFWFLSQSNTDRIFENKTSLDIAQEVIGSYGGFCSLETKTSGTYLKREYCVQFNETDLEFVQRILAEDGISYYFSFTETSHTQVLTDQSNGFVDCATSKVVKQGVARLEGDQGSVISRWSRRLSYHPASMQHLDYNQDTPKNFYPQQVSTTSAFAQTPPINAIQGYGCYNFKTNSGACHDFDVPYNKLLTETRMEAYECQHNVADGSSNCATFLPGSRFEIVHHVKSESGQYLITEVSHQAHNDIDGTSDYQNQFRCIPAKVVPRPALPHYKRRMPGPQTAKVMSLSASASSPDADPQRMVKVQFPWDSQHNSCKLRVLQGYAGSGWGASFVPREGQEVLVDFINGDPDRPLVVGGLYNKDNQGPKYTSTQSGWLTQSGNANELRFDDKGGAEEVYLEAGKDWNFVVANNVTGQVGNNESVSVGSNRTASVGADETITIGANQSRTVGQNQTLTVGQNQSITIGSNKTETIAVNCAETIGVAKELTIGGAYQVSVGAAMNETVAGIKAEEVGASKSVAVGMSMSEDVGKNRSITVSDTSSHKAKKINITAEDELTIKVGSASIHMKKDGTIEISGKDITLKASGKINAKASSDVVIKGSKVGLN